MLTDDLIVRLHSAALRANAEGLVGTAEALAELLRREGNWDVDIFREVRRSEIRRSVVVSNSDRVHPLGGH